MIDENLDVLELMHQKRRDQLLWSGGMEPSTLENREKCLLLARMLSLVENNFNLCELGARSTGKSHLCKEIFPNSILVSGGQTTVALMNGTRRSKGIILAKKKVKHYFGASFF